MIRPVVLLIGVSLLALFEMRNARGQEGDDFASEGQEAGYEGVPPPPVSRPPSRKQRNRNVEKETDGTEALGRFEADTVIRSTYQLNGEPLEVDPD